MQTDNESDSEIELVDYTTTTKETIDSSLFPALELPFTAQDVISRIEQAQLCRAREDINIQLGDIMLNVQKVINRYTVDEHVHSGRKISFVEHKKRRMNLLEKIATYAKAAEKREKILVYILAWLQEWNAIMSEMTEIDIDEHHHWIAQIQILPETFKAIENNVKTLTRISSSLMEEKKKQKRKLTSRSILWKSWKDRVIKRPATAHALRPDQMISDEFATNIKVSEIQDMLQELIGTAMFNKLENNAIKYISSTIANLSTALSRVNEEVKFFNFQTANMYTSELSERQKELSLKIIQDLSEKNEILQQQLQETEQKYEQFIRSKGVVEQQVYTALPTSTLKVLPEPSPQSSTVISKVDIEDRMDNILAKEFENVVDDVQRTGTKASAIKWDSTISHTGQVEMTSDLTEQQQHLPGKKKKKSPEDVTEDKISLKKGDVYQKDGTDLYQSQKRKHTRGSSMHETSGSNLSDDKGKYKDLETKLDHHSELQALEKKKKEGKSSFETKSKSPIESKRQRVPDDYPSTNTNIKGGKSGTSSMWDQPKKVKPERSLDKSQISSETKEEPTTESMDKKSKREKSSQAEPSRLTQLGYSSEKVKTTGKKHPISLGTTTSKEGIIEEKDVLVNKKVKSQELVKSRSRTTKETSESTSALGSLDGKSEQSNLEEFQKAIMAFLKEKIDNIGKPLDKKTVPKKESLLKRAEVEKLGIIKAKMEEYFQNVAETVTKILRKYKDIKNAEQVGEKPLKQRKVASFMPGLHFQKPTSEKSEISTLLSDKSMDPVIGNLIQMILTEIETKRDVPVDSIGERDHKEKEEQRQEEYLQDDQEKIFGMSLKNQLEERNLWKKSHEMINKDLEKEEAWLQKKEGKQGQQEQKQWQEVEVWKEQREQRMQKRIKQDKKQKQREEEEEEHQKPKQQQLEARKQKMKEQGVPLEKDKEQQTRQVQKKVRHLEVEGSSEKEQGEQKPRRKIKDHERQEQKKAKDQMKIKEKSSEELEKMFSQTSETSPKWKSIQKDTSQLYQREEFHGNLMTLDILADGKHPTPITPPASTQSSSPGAFPISGQSPKKSITLTTQQAQALGISVTPQQAQTLGISLSPQQAQTQGISLTPQQAKTKGISLTPQQAQTQGISLTPQKAQALGISLTPQQAKTQGISLTPQQAQTQGISLTPQQAQTQGISLTPQQAQTQGISLTPQQAQTQGIGLSREQAQALGIGLTPQQAQALGITLTPEQAQTLGISLTPQQAQTQGISLTPQQAQTQGIGLSPEQAQALGIGLTPQQAQALGITLTPQQAQTLGISLTPQQAQTQGITLTPQQAQTLGITLTPQQAQTEGISLSPEQAQALGISLTPQQAQTEGSSLTPQQAQALGITLTPEQAQTLGISLTPQQAQALGISLTHEEAQALGITLTPEQAQTLGISLTPEQAQALGISLTPQQAQALGISLTHEEAQALGITLTPEQAQTLGISLTPQQAQSQGITLTPQQAQALGLSLTPQQAQALGISLSPQQARALGISLTPEQTQALGITLTPEQAQTLGISLTPQQAQTQGITLTPQQAQALGISFTPQQAQALGISLSPQQAQALGISLTPEQAQTQGISLAAEQTQTQGISLTPEQAQTLGISLTPQQAQTQGISLTPQQAQTQGISLTPQQAQTLGISLTPQQAQAQGISLTPQQAQALGISLTPQQAQAQGISLTPQQAQALGISLTPQQAQEQGISLTPEQAQALGITLTPEQAQALGITLTPEQAQALGITLTPEQAQALGISLTPQQAQALGISVTPQPAPAQGKPPTSEQFKALVVTLTPEKSQSLGVTLTPEQVQALAPPLTSEQAQSLEVSLTPEQAQSLQDLLIPEQAEALVFTLTPEKGRTLGITCAHEQAQAVDITLTPEQARALRVPLSLDQARAVKTPLTSGQAWKLGVPITPEVVQEVSNTHILKQIQALGVTPSHEKAQTLGTPSTLDAAQELGVPTTPENAWVSAVTLTPEETWALGAPITLERAQALGFSLSPEQYWESGVPLTSDTVHALGSPLTPEQVQPLGAPFTPGQAQPMGTTLMSEQDLKSRAPLLNEQPSQLWTGPPSGHTQETGIFSSTDKSVTPSALCISKQSLTLVPSTLRPFQESKASLPSGKSITSRPRQFPASSAPIVEKSSIFEVPSTLLQISKFPPTQALTQRQGMRILSDSGNLLAPQTFPSSRQIQVSKDESTPVQFLTPEVPPTPRKLSIPGVQPSSGQLLALKDLLSSREFFTSRDALISQSPLIMKAPFVARQPLISGVPPTSAQIPNLSDISPGKPMVPEASSTHEELLESGPLTQSEQLQALQPPATHEQYPYLQAPYTLGQHLAPWTLPRQASPLWIPPPPGHPPTLWVPSTPGKPQKDLSSSVSKKSKERLAIISSLKSKSALAHPSAPNVKMKQAPFIIKKLQISEVSDTSEKMQIRHDPCAMEQFRTFQSYLTNYRTPKSQTSYTGEGVLPTLMKPIPSLPSLTAQLPKTSQISPTEWDQKSRFPPIDKSWMLTSVSGTKKPKTMVPSSSPQELKEQRYFVDVEAQRKNLILLNQATKASGLPSELHTTARDLIIETLHTDKVRLGYLFRKYIAYRLIQRARNNLIKRLQAIQNTGKGYETQNLYIMLSRIDDYQKKVMRVWTKKQKSLEQKRNQCLRKMILLFTKLQDVYKLNLSQPIPLIINKKQIPASTKFVQQPFLELLMQEDRKPDIFKKFRQEDQMEAIWNADLSTSSYPITEKTSIHSLWAQLGGYPDIPMLLQLDVQATFRKSLAFIQSQFKKTPK
uniref:Family with sequence similarity 186 member A n=1 Tax=Equus caballus TaxID=9796 RepID=A0A5F5PVL3_HORSE|nr:protein FAM186A [Equus caballus]